MRNDEKKKIAVGQRLQEIRGSRDQRSFAESVDSVQQTISKYERGEIPRSWLFLARLANEEKVDLNRLILGERYRDIVPRDNGGRESQGDYREERSRKYA